MRILGFEIRRAPRDEGGGPQASISYKDVPLSAYDGTAGQEISTAFGAETALKSPAAYRSITLLSGVAANMPVAVKRRRNGAREDATDHPLWNIITRRPNSWQTSQEFRRQLMMHVLLRGNGYAMKAMAGNRLAGLIPLMPDRMTVKQRDDLSLEYRYTTKDRGQIVLEQRDVLHLRGYSLDGIVGISPLTYARETLGLALNMQRHAATLFANGARVSGTLTHPDTLGAEASERLKQGIDEFTAGGAREGRTLILEEGIKYERIGLSMEDAQFVEAAGLSRTDIYMLFGVPPHMAGDVQKSTSFGTGLEQQTQGFITFSAEDWISMWEQSLARDCLQAGETDVYVRFNRNALVRSDIRSRYAAYAIARQWGFEMIDEIRELEDRNPLPDGLGANPFTGGNAQRPGGEAGGDGSGDIEARLAALENR
jgi:HK97 family phage portal protein